jgi:hypothetical protein
MTPTLKAAKYKGIARGDNTVQNDLEHLCMIYDCNDHSHKPTCEKSARARATGLCRSNKPAVPVAKTSVTVKETPESTKFVAMELEKQPDSIWLNNHSRIMSLIFGCNTNVSYCVDCAVGFYQGMYATKSTKENTQSLMGAVKSVHRVMEREQVEEAEMKIHELPSDGKRACGE